MLKRDLYLHCSRFVPPGHYYSPIPSDEEIELWSKNPRSASELGLDRRVPQQESLATSLAKFYPEIPFKDQADGDLRYYYQNTFFSYSDAIFLHLLIRHLEPRRIIEVGSGFSSAVMLDTVGRFLKGNSQLSFVEPYPERLQSLLRPDDTNRCTVIQKRVQDVGVTPFLALEANDILFIDSTHITKVGSDVNFLLFEVLPHLKPGVWVHIHDIFPNFDYPVATVRDGIAWNEAYIVRAFLTFNSDFEIALHVPHFVENHREWLKNNMPDCLKSSGGSLWLRRKNLPTNS